MYTFLYTIKCNNVYVFNNFILLITEFLICQNWGRERVQLWDRYNMAKNYFIQKSSFGSLEQTVFG